MNVTQIFADKKVALTAFGKVGMVRIPFTDLNPEPSDMLSIYAEPLLDPNEYDQIVDALSERDYEYLIPKASSMYIFNRNAYDTFLKLVVAEDVKAPTGCVRTEKLDVIYTSNESFAVTTLPRVLDGCLSDSILKAYGSVFDPGYSYLIHCDTSMQKKDCQRVLISEFLLYLAE